MLVDAVSRCAEKLGVSGCYHVLQVPHLMSLLDAGDCTTVNTHFHEIKCGYSDSTQMGMRRRTSDFDELFFLDPKLYSYIESLSSHMKHN